MEFVRQPASSGVAVGALVGDLEGAAVGAFVGASVHATAVMDTSYFSSSSSSSFAPWVNIEAQFPAPEFNRRKRGRNCDHKLSALAFLPVRTPTWLPSSSHFRELAAIIAFVTSTGQPPIQSVCSAAMANALDSIHVAPEAA